MSREITWTILYVSNVYFLFVSVQFLSNPLKSSGYYMYHKKYGPTKWALKVQNGDFLENGYNDNDPIIAIYGDHFLK